MLKRNYFYSSADLNQIDKLFQEFDNMLVPNLSPENVFALLDASSILWRLNVS